jgi:cytidylate kinase
MKREKPIVAIDGPVGVGKSCVAARLAERLQFIYIDTGAMYRSVAYTALQKGVDLNDRDTIAQIANSIEIEFIRSEDGLQIYCDGQNVSEQIRLPEVSVATSPVADNVEVRNRLVTLQQQMGKDGGVVMEGRDISTVVFPDAELKIYLDADPKVRAERRYQQLIAKGKEVDFESTYQDLLERDRRDKERPVGALKVADRAIVVDSTGMSEDGVIDRLSRIVHEYMDNNGQG